MLSQRAKTDSHPNSTIQNTYKGGKEAYSHPRAFKTLGGEGDVNGRMRVVFNGRINSWNALCFKESGTILFSEVYLPILQYEPVALGGRVSLASRT